MKRPRSGSRRDGRERGKPQAEPESEWIYGIHPVCERLENDPGSVERVFVMAERGGGRIGQALRLARGRGVAISHLPRPVFERKVRAGGHQGIAATVAAVPYASADELCAAAAADPEAMLVVLDGVVDAGNLGAILRTCAAAGVRGVLLPAEHSAGLGAGVAKSSAGAATRVPVARERRLARRLDDLRSRGFSVVALDPRAAHPWTSAPLNGRCVILAGGEERGLRPSLSRHSDRRVSLPVCEGVDSLNVSVAVGVMLYEALRQRRREKGES